MASQLTQPRDSVLIIRSDEEEDAIAVGNLIRQAASKCSPETGSGTIPAKLLDTYFDDADVRRHGKDFIARVTGRLSDKLEEQEKNNSAQEPPRAIPSKETPRRKPSQKQAKTPLRNSHVYSEPMSPATPNLVSGSRMAPIQLISSPPPRCTVCGRNHRPTESCDDPSPNFDKFGRPRAATHLGYDGTWATLNQMPGIPEHQLPDDDSQSMPTMPFHKPTMFDGQAPYYWSNEVVRRPRGKSMLNGRSEASVHSNHSNTYANNVKAEQQVASVKIAPSEDARNHSSESKTKEDANRFEKMQFKGNPRSSQKGRRHRKLEEASKAFIPSQSVRNSFEQGQNQMMGNIPGVAPFLSYGYYPEVQYPFVPMMQNYPIQPHPQSMNPAVMPFAPMHPEQVLHHQAQPAPELAPAFNTDSSSKERKMTKKKKKKPSAPSSASVTPPKEPGQATEKKQNSHNGSPKKQHAKKKPASTKKENKTNKPGSKSPLPTEPKANETAVKPSSPGSPTTQSKTDIVNRDEIRTELTQPEPKQPRSLIPAVPDVRLLKGKKSNDTVASNDSGLAMVPEQSPLIVSNPTRNNHPSDDPQTPCSASTTAPLATNHPTSPPTFSPSSPTDQSPRSFSPDTESSTGSGSGGVANAKRSRRASAVQIIKAHMYRRLSQTDRYNAMMADVPRAPSSQAMASDNSSDTAGKRSRTTSIENGRARPVGEMPAVAAEVGRVIGMKSGSPKPEDNPEDMYPKISPFASVSDGGGTRRVSS